MSTHAYLTAASTHKTHAGRTTVCMCISSTCLRLVDFLIITLYLDTLLPPLLVCIITVIHLFQYHVFTYLDMYFDCYARVSRQFWPNRSDHNKIMCEPGSTVWVIGNHERRKSDQFSTPSMYEVCISLTRLDMSCMQLILVDIGKHQQHSCLCAIIFLRHTVSFTLG